MTKHIPKIVITGGAGFIGSHLSNKLSNLGYKVYALDDLSNGDKSALGANVNFFKVDITSKEFKNLIVKIKPELIYHLAAQSSIEKSYKNPINDIKVNLLATQQLIDVAKSISVKKIIFSSSAAIYGENNNLPITENAFKSPLSIYGLTKLCSEYMFRTNCILNKTEYACLRYSNVYGPGQDFSAEGGVVAIFIDHILKNTNITIFNDGDQTRDFIHVSDVVSANIRALDIKARGNFNVSTGEQTSINDLADLLSEISSKPIKKLFQKLAHREVRKSALDPSKFQKVTNWKSATNLKIGLSETYNYFDMK